MRKLLPAILFAALAVAHAAGTAGATNHFIGCKGEIVLDAPRVDATPTIDGRLDESVWQQAAVLDSFTHNRPVEGVQDSLGTQCLVFYDDTHLYVGFRCKDDPAKIQAPIVPRDQIWQGDWVGVSLDTYHDKQRSFFFGVNPQGIQMDGVDQEGNDTDLSRDFIYTSSARLTDDGFEVEMAIPFKSLRFPEHNPLTFGFNAIRDVRRDGTHMFWAPISRDINNYHAQIGSIGSIQGVKPGRNLQFTPTYTGTSRGVRDDNSVFTTEPYDNRFGFDLKMGVTSSLTLDGTITPDFSQVESDAGVVDINERFAIFFPERRPFFLEGSDIFNNPIDLVYTRRIVDPRGGVKLSGKQGKTSIGVLGAMDRSAGQPIETLSDAANPYFDKDAAFGIARFKRDVLKNSYVGALAATREHVDAYNRVAGIDGRLTFQDKYEIEFQGAGSWSRDENLTNAINGLSPAERNALDSDLLDLNGQTSSGEAWFLAAERETRGLGLMVFGRGVSPDFHADMGFIRRRDIQEYGGWVNEHYWAKPNQWYTAFHTWTGYERLHDYGTRGRRLDDIFVKGGELVLPRNTWIGAGYNRVFTHFDGADFRGQNRINFWAGSERFQTVRGGFDGSFRDVVIFDETAAGRAFNWGLWTDFRFTRQMDAGLRVSGSNIKRRENDSRFRSAMIPRLRVSYQFTKELSIRAIGELQRQREYDMSDQLVSRSESVLLDLLATYLVRPGTVVYFGYGSFLEGQEFDKAEPQVRSLFLKLSYLWQN